MALEDKKNDTKQRTTRQPRAVRAFEVEKFGCPISGFNVSDLVPDLVDVAASTDKLLIYSFCINTARQ